MLSVFHWSSASHTSRWLNAEELRRDIDQLRSTSDLLWVDLERPDDAEEQLVFDQLLRVHTLTREDITREHRDPKRLPHLPKVEEFPDYLFVVVNPLHPKVFDRLKKPADGTPRGRASCQLSAVLAERRLVTHHYETVTSIQKLHNYLDRHPEQAERGPDFLFHLILDEMVDEYVPVLDHVTDALDAMEVQIFRRPNRASIPRLLHLKRDIILLRKTLVYEREVLARLSRGEFALIDQRETVYYRNVYDHLVRFTELIESSREMVSDLMESHLSATSNRLNEIMKVLTMLSTILLPMTVVAGIYGMNFDPDVSPWNMPELKWYYGYPFALTLVALAGLVPLAFFKWRRWF